MLVDTHCHLDFEAFDRDREEIIARAKDAGVKRILDPGIDLDSSRAAVRLAEAYPEVYAAVGIHPNDSLKWNEEARLALRELASHPKASAIGEIGLDYYREWAPPDVQQEAFLQQLDLAAELELPVILHNRQAGADLLAHLTRWHQTLVAAGSPLAARPGVLHSFSEDEKFAEKAAGLGFLIGITGPVTFRNAPELQRVVAGLPLDVLLIETDSPFLTPHPHRGKRNEPAFVRLVAEKIAQIHQVPLELVAETTSSNAERLFNWPITIYPQ